MTDSYREDAAASAQIAQAPVLVLTMLRETTGGKRERAQRLVNAALEDLPKHLVALVEAAANEDRETAFRMAHSMKGLAGYVGAERVRLLALEGERLTSNGGLSHIPAFAPTVKSAIAEALDALRRIDWENF